LERSPIHPPSPSLRILLRPDPERVVVSVAGEIDIDTVGGLRSALDDLQCRGWRSIALDLREVGFMDSSGLHLLLATCTGADGSAVWLEHGSDEVRRVLELSGVAPLIARDAPRSPRIAARVRSSDAPRLR
jgi:anti-sigma B factor antagonist